MKTKQILFYSEYIHILLINHGNYYTLELQKLQES